MEACVDDPRARFTLVYDFLIDASGHVSGVALTNSPSRHVDSRLEVQALGACITAVLTRVTFPSDPTPAWLSVEISRGVSGE